ncbi:MAG: hypothetical protein K0R15_218 [Clostridiales bacterium]|jgi:hypothetical protein|nr:hypothetical protein [Clostridiales bacterium]
MTIFIKTLSYNICIKTQGGENMDENNKKETQMNDFLKIAIQEIRENIEKAPPREINFLKAVKPYLNKRSQKQIEKIANIVNDVRVYENIVSEGGGIKNPTLHEDEESVYVASQNDLDKDNNISTNNNDLTNNNDSTINNEKLTQLELLMLIASSLK